MTKTIKMSNKEFCKRSKEFFFKREKERKREETVRERDK